MWPERTKIMTTTIWYAHGHRQKKTWLPGRPQIDYVNSIFFFKSFKTYIHVHRLYTIGTRLIIIFSFLFSIVQRKKNWWNRVIFFSSFSSGPGNCEIWKKKDYIKNASLPFFFFFCFVLLLTLEWIRILAGGVPPLDTIPHERHFSSFLFFFTSRSVATDDRDSTRGGEPPHDRANSTSVST
jgi:hypothetical protein